ncbi:MAG: inositol monophosphatase [Paramuribaculum sp.]|nr:inositol monophosphatase [Paramuribaculum sp.]
MERDYEILADAAEAIARAAGARLLEFFRREHLQVETKLNESDIVTEADRASEETILRLVSERFPTHSVLSEESGESVRDGEFRWVIDPLDGTTNFRCGLPFFSVSIGIEHFGEAVAGVVYAPQLGEMFRGVRGGGATLNGKPMACSSIPSLDRSVLATGFPVDKSVNPDNNLDNVGRLLPRIRGLRRLGSAAIDICYTAAGFLEGYWEMNLHDWDITAGMVIAREAGCLTGEFRSDRNRSVVVAPPQLFDEIRRELSSRPGSADIKKTTF